MKLWDWLMSFAEELGKARAATTLSRMGKYEEARRVMQG